MKGNMYKITIILILALAVSAFGQTTYKCDNDEDIEDSFIKSYAATTNYGTVEREFLYEDGGLYSWYIIKASNVNDSIGAGATIGFAACSAYIDDHDPGNPSIIAHGMWKSNMEESEVTWNVWKTDYEWGTAGCNSMNDEGEFNELDGEGDDRRETEEDICETSGTGWIGLEIASWAQTCYDADEPISIRLSTEVCKDGEYMQTREGENEPFFVFVYTTDGADAYEGQAIIIGGN